MAVAALALGLRSLPGHQWVWLLLGAPLAEELVFRAGLQAWLQQRWPAIGAVLASSLAFAASHVVLAPSWLAAATFLPSLVLGALYARTARVAPCVALHMVFNAVWWMEAAPLLRLQIS